MSPNFLIKSSKESECLRAGDVFPVSQEELLDFIVNAYNKINYGNRMNCWIAESFKKSGLDPRSDTTEVAFGERLCKLLDSKRW